MMFAELEPRARGENYQRDERDGKLLAIPRTAQKPESRAEKTCRNDNELVLENRFEYERRNQRIECTAKCSAECHQQIKLGEVFARRTRCRKLAVKYECRRSKHEQV